jgi:hypothetical protein
VRRVLDFEAIWRIPFAATYWREKVRTDDLLKSFDARVWAAAFMETLRENPAITVDHELMVTWFANSLMRGYDEHYWKSSEYRRSIRRALFPWWSWKHWVAAPLPMEEPGK